MYRNFNAHDGNIQSQFGIFSLFFRLFDFPTLNNICMTKSVLFWISNKICNWVQEYVFKNCAFLGFPFDFDFPFSSSFQSNIQISKHSLIKLCESSPYFKWNEWENKYFLYNIGWFFIVKESRVRFRQNSLCWISWSGELWKLWKITGVIELLKWKNFCFPFHHS